MAVEGLIEIPEGAYQLASSTKWHIVISGGKAYLAPSGPQTPISDLFPDAPTPSPTPGPSPAPAPAPAAPSNVVLWLKANGQKILTGLLFVAVLVLAFWRFHPAVPVPPGPPPGPPPRPPWVPPNPPPAPNPTPNPRVRQLDEEVYPTAEPGPEPDSRKRGVR